MQTSRFLSEFLPSLSSAQQDSFREDINSEIYLGNPPQEGHTLTSTVAGHRFWASLGEITLESLFSKIVKDVEVQENVDYFIYDHDILKSIEIPDGGPTGTGSHSGTDPETGPYNEDRVNFSQVTRSGIVDLSLYLS